LDIQHNKKDAGIKQLMSDCMFGNMEAVDKKSTIHREIQDNDKSLTTSGGSANILMKNLACFVVAPDIRRSVVTMPGCTECTHNSHNCTFSVS